MHNATCSWGLGCGVDSLAQAAKGPASGLHLCQQTANNDKCADNKCLLGPDLLLCICAPAADATIMCPLSPILLPMLGYTINQVG